MLKTAEAHFRFTKPRTFLFPRKHLVLNANRHDHLSYSHHIYLLNINSPCVNKNFSRHNLAIWGRSFNYRHVHLRNIALFLNEYMSATLPMFLKCLLLFFSFATAKLIWRLRCNGFICWIFIYSFFHLLGIVYYTFQRSSKRTPIIFICLTMSHLNLILWF